MRGLLGSRPINTRNGGLLSLLATPSRAPQADAMDEWFLRAGGAQDRTGEAPFSGASAPAPAPQSGLLTAPQRERVSGWRLLDRVLGGQTISEGLDAERARLSAEAMRPQLIERQAQLRALAEQMGPAALIAFDTNPEKFGENLAEQYAPQVIAAGGVQSVIGDGRRIAAPSFAEFGQDMVRRDPITGAVETVAQRGPTFAEQTARLSAQTENVAPNGRLVDVASGRVVAEGVQRPDVVSLSPGGEAVAFDAGGRQINRVASTQPREAISPVDAAKARGGVQYIQAQAQTVRGAVARARELARTPGAVGFLGGLPAIPGTPGADLEAQLATIKSNLTQQALAQMRANSPTGGALGSVSDRENDMLAAGVASLNRAQSPAQFNQALDQIERAMENLSRISEQNYQQTYGEQRQARGISPEAARAELRRRGVAGY